MRYLRSFVQEIVSFTIYGDLNRCIWDRPLNAKSVPNNPDFVGRLRARKNWDRGNGIVRISGLWTNSNATFLVRGQKDEFTDILAMKGERVGRQQGARSLQEPRREPVKESREQR